MDTLPERPYVILSAAMSLDGKIATKTRDSKISCQEDLKRVHELRASVDAIMVGITTVLIDDPSLTVKLVPGISPIRVIVDSRARTPPNARAIKENRETKTIIAVTNSAPKDHVKNLLNAGADVIFAGDGKDVDLKFLLNELHRRGVKRLLVEGGGTLNWSLFSAKLIDEIRVAVAPIIIGGADAVTLVEGDGVSTINEAFKLEFKKAETCGEDLVITYYVKKGA
jgi:2,5-diamino-6-(ribosylamino)-4(3H)-pyrimidinone 5'-phosphate reductase